MIDRSSSSTNNVERQERLDYLASESDRLREQENRFGEPSDAAIANELSERARLFRERDDEQRRILAEPILSDELREAAYEAYPELEASVEACAAMTRKRKLDEIERLEQQILTLRDELGDEIVWDE